MNFKKDILLVDLESTGLDPSKHEIIQIAAILLDKKTLREKRFFNTYVKPQKWKNRDPQAMKINKIEFEQLKLAPLLKFAITEFNKYFNPRNVIFSHYGGPLDTDMMRAAYKKCNLKFEFDHHYFNLWGLFYSYMALKEKIFDKKKFAGFGLDDFLNYFEISVPDGRHDALTDCRVEARAQ